MGHALTHFAERLPDNTDLRNNPFAAMSWLISRGASGHTVKMLVDALQTFRESVQLLIGADHGWRWAAALPLRDWVTAWNETPEAKEEVHREWEEGTERARQAWAPILAALAAAA